MKTDTPHTVSQVRSYIISIEPAWRGGGFGTLAAAGNRARRVLLFTIIAPSWAIEEAWQTHTAARPPVGGGDGIVGPWSVLGTAWCLASVINDRHDGIGGRMAGEGEGRRQLEWLGVGNVTQWWWCGWW